MKRIHKFNRNAARLLAGCMEQPLEVPWQMLHEQQQQEGPSDPPKKVTLEEQLTSARSELATAQSSLDAATKDRDTAKSEVTRLTSERDALQTQFDALTTEATKAKTDLVTMTSERDTHQAASEAKDKTITAKDSRIKNLESLCGIKGLNPDAAPPALDEPKAELTTAQWEAKYAAASTTEARKKVVDEMEAAAAAKKKAGK